MSGQFDFTNAAFPADSVTLLNPVRSTFGPSDIENFSTRVGDIALSMNDIGSNLRPHLR